MNDRWISRVTAIVATTALLAVSTGIRAADDESGQNREGGMKTIGANFKTVKEAVDAAKAPDDASAKAAETIAATILAWHQAIRQGPENVTAEKAKPEVWSKADDLAAHVASFRVQVAKLDEAAKGSDAVTLKAQFAAVGKECKACHDTFKMP